MNVEAILASVKAKAQQKCEQADIGATMRIRLDKKTVVSGILKKAEAAQPYIAGGYVRCGFRVTLVCGTDKVERTFNVSSLPA